MYRPAVASPQGTCNADPPRHLGCSAIRFANRPGRIEVDTAKKNLLPCHTPSHIDWLTTTPAQSAGRGSRTGLGLCLANVGDFAASSFGVFAAAGAATNRVLDLCATLFGVRPALELRSLAMAACGLTLQLLAKIRLHDSIYMGLLSLLLNRIQCLWPSIRAVPSANTLAGEVNLPYLHGFGRRPGPSLSGGHRTVVPLAPFLWINKGRFAHWARRVWYTRDT